MHPSIDEEKHETQTIGRGRGRRTDRITQFLRRLSPPPASAGVSYATQAQVSAAQATATKALAAAKADATHLNSVVAQIKACFNQFPASPPCP